MNFEMLGREIESRMSSAVALSLEFAADVFTEVQTRLTEEKKREEINQLLSLEDSQLKDMGISRDDVRSALMRPLNTNSGKYLEKVRRNALLKI
ncbi:MAG: DUF1127 domain-containing protein [Pseudomonadota bacterium]